GNGEAGLRHRGQGDHGTGGRHAVNGVPPRVGLDGFVVVEDDGGPVSDERAGECAGLGADGVGDVAFTDVVRDVGRQQAKRSAFRRLAGGWVDGRQRPTHFTALEV